MCGGGGRGWGVEKKMKGEKEKKSKIECYINRKSVNLLRMKVLWEWH